MAQKQMSFGINTRLHGLLQFVNKDRKVQRAWPWKQKEIVAVALGAWIARHGGADVDAAAIAAELPQPPDEIEEGGEPLVFHRKKFEPGTGTLSFKLPRALTAAFERVCHEQGSKKGKAVARALRDWLRNNGYGELLVQLELGGSDEV